MEENPFPDTEISDWHFLDAPGTRNQCPKCNKSRKYYCYTCYVPLSHLASYLPKVKLPIKVDIIKHPSEIDGKSTCSHAAILAPDDVAIHTYPCIPDYDNKKVVLVFPCEESLSLEDLAAQRSNKQSLKINNTAEKDKSVGQGEHKIDDISSSELIVKDASERTSKNCQDNGDLDEPPCKQMKLFHNYYLPFDRVVFIDSTWNQTRNILSDERLKNLKKVELKSRSTHFWRMQNGIPKSYLSTIEAIYYFMKDFHSLFLDSEYKHEYDNLLFFFCYMYNKIRNSAHGGQNIKAYQR